MCSTLAWFGTGPAMKTVTVTTKGQVTLRKDMLEHAGVRPEEQIIVMKLPDGRIEFRAARLTGRISDVFGKLKAQRRGKATSIDAINKIISRGWSGKL